MYHGSYQEIKQPDLKHTRVDVDFGRGFYLTYDPILASKWACKRDHSVLNAYRLDSTDLKIKMFGLTKEWLDYVSFNRMGMKDTDYGFDDTKYDVIIGAIADDKLFDTVDDYAAGMLRANDAIKILNCMDYGTQVTLKTDKAIQALSFERSKELKGLEKQQLREQFAEDGIKARRLTRELRKELMKEDIS